MWTEVFGLVGRHRIAALVASLAAAVTLGVLGARPNVVFVLMLALLGLGLLASRLYHPATLVVCSKPCAFDAPTNAGLVIILAAVTVQSGTGMVGVAQRVLRGEESPITGLVAGVLGAGFLTLAWRQVFGRVRLRLRPEGVEEIQTFGYVLARWEAFDGVDHPAVAVGRNKVLLNYSRPDLVRRGGWRSYRTALPADGIDAVFLSRVLHEYAHRPELRAAIGSEAERDRLVQRWGGARA